MKLDWVELPGRELVLIICEMCGDQPIFLLRWPVKHPKACSANQQLPSHAGESVNQRRVTGGKFANPRCLVATTTPSDLPKRAFPARYRVC